MGLLESSRSRARLRRLIFSFAIPPLFRYDDLVCFFSRRRYGKENTEAKDQHEPKRYNDENKAKHEGQRVHASVFVSRVPAKDVPSTSPRRYGGQRVGYRNNYAQVRDCPARDEFFPTGGCDLDVTVHVIQFDANKNDIINQYIAFCRVFDDLRKKYGYSPQTIRDTLCICRDKDILAEYVKKMENEIMNIMEYMFDQDNVTRLYGIEQMNLGRKEGREEGKIEGREEGKIEGREEGKKEEKKATAINLLDMNIDVGVIEKATGLSQAEILKLKHH